MANHKTNFYCSARSSSQRTARTISDLVPPRRAVSIEVISKKKEELLPVVFPNLQSQKERIRKPVLSIR